MKWRLAVGGFNFIHAVGLDFICAADFILAKARMNDLIVMDGFCTVINGNDLNREGLRVLLAYFMDVGDRLDETVVWLGKVELPNLPSFVQCENFLQLLLNCEQFILRNRDTVQDPDSNRPLTFHGLLHAYAAEKYRQLIADGISELDAHLTVSKLLGHERADVTNIYLTSTKNKILWFESGFC